MRLNEPLLTQLPCNLGELPIPQVLSVTTKKSGPVSNTCHPDLFAATAIVNDHPIHYVESEIQKNEPKQNIRTVSDEDSKTRFVWSADSPLRGPDGISQALGGT